MNGGDFACTKCVLSFVQKRSLANHYVREHNENIVELANILAGLQKNKRSRPVDAPERAAVQISPTRKRQRTEDAMDVVDQMTHFTTSVNKQMSTLTANMYAEIVELKAQIDDLKKENERLFTQLLEKRKEISRSTFREKSVPGSSAAPSTVAPSSDTDGSPYKRPVSPPTPVLTKEEPVVYDDEDDMASLIKNFNSPSK